MMHRQCLMILLLLWLPHPSLACSTNREVDVNFEKGSISLSAASSERLETAISIYKPLDKASFYEIYAIGHANLDDHATPEGRRMISIRRAMAVRDWLVNRGIPYSAIDVSAKGAEWAEREGSNETRRVVNLHLGIVAFPDPCAKVAPIQRR